MAEVAPSSGSRSAPSKKRTSVWSRYTTGSVYAAEVSRRRTEAAGLLALWSAAVVVEGLVRFVTSDATRELLPNNRPSTVVPPLLPFLGALFEVVFGVWFTYIVWVFLMPAYRWRLDEPTVLGVGEVVSVARTHGLIATGIVTSSAFCAALQGGQFVFGLRLLAFQAQQAVEAPPALLTVGLGYNRLRAVFWSALMALGGGGTLAAGIVLTIAVGGGRLAAPFFFDFPPHVGVFPIQTIVTGGVMVAHGLLGLAAAVAAAGTGRPARGVVSLHVHATPLVWVVLLLNFSLVQIAAVGPAGMGVGQGRLAYAAAVHAGLTLVATFIGPYFVVAASRDADEDGPGGGNPA
ncbi:hypothetical protein I4F81_006217 [Pyropia yezoensis]|uniref:Uncharacterized protein n=1 Tax=Pyropia yezoensis TaxID=2788 RepID=A0ACC3C0N0_PYRYE|nr:hypothetical protein I4F81_006217 [Neopyropia yezoensis]